MKKILFFTALLVSGILQGALPIVFVHLGHGFPSYMYTAIRQGTLFNPDTDIYVVVHDRTWKMLTKQRRFPQNVHLVNRRTLPISEKHKKFAQIGSSEMNYWRYTLERFYVVEELMEAYHLDDVLQLEGDNLIYCNVTELQPLLEKGCPNIGIPYITDTRCTPGIVYIGNREALAAYNERIPAYIQKYQKFSDMDFFADFAKETGLLTPLPTIPFLYEKKGHSFTSLEGKTSQAPHLYSENFELFHGLFDALPYGVFLDGVSPIHREYKIKKRLEESIIDPTVFTYVWKKDDQGRRCLYASLDGEMWPILDLHVHSKDLEKFASDR